MSTLSLEQFALIQRVLEEGQALGADIQWEVGGATSMMEHSYRLRLKIQGVRLELLFEPGTGRPYGIRDPMSFDFSRGESLRGVVMEHLEQQRERYAAALDRVTHT